MTDQDGLGPAKQRLGITLLNSNDQRVLRAMIMRKPYPFSLYLILNFKDGTRTVVLACDERRVGVERP